MIRIAIKCVSVILGLLVIAVTFSGGHVEYRGFDSPIIGLAVGIALIVTPGGTLIMVLGYLMLIALIVSSGVLVGALLSRLLGTFGVYIGFLLGLALGGWIAVVSKGFELIGKIVAWVDRKP